MALAEKSSNVARLHFGRVKEIQHAYNQWFAEVPAGTTIEAVTEPSYWAHYTKQMRPLDTIEVFCEDGSWEGRFRVMFVGPGEVRIRHIKQTELSDMVESLLVHKELLSDIYDVEWRGPAAKFAVINKKTKEVIKDHLYPKKEAVNYLSKHLASMKD